jgi:hypothetical protein
MSRGMTITCRSYPRNRQWSLTLKHEHRQGAEENIWIKEDELMVGWRKLQNKELHDLCSSPSVIRMIKLRRMRWMGHVI